jgi:flagellar hook-associated protein 2
MASTPLIGFNGFATGLDTQAIIDALSGVKRVPILKLEAQKAKLQKQQTEFGSLKAKLEALRTKANGIDSLSELAAFSTATTDSTVATATAAGGATSGTYSIVVNNLAETESRALTGVAAKTGVAIGSGTINFAVGGENFGVVIPANSDLEAIRDAINESDAPVSATIINDGTPGTPYRLVVTSDASGAAAAFTPDLSQFTPASGALAFTTLSTGQDAQFTLNGLPLTRSSNSVADAITGVTLNLAKETSGGVAAATTVTITEDHEKVKTKVKELITALNDVLDVVRTQSNHELRESKAVLYGDSTIRRIASTLRGAIDTEVDSGSVYSTLASIGVKTGTDGRLPKQASSRPTRSRCGRTGSRPASAASTGRSRSSRRTSTSTSRISAGSTPISSPSRDGCRRREARCRASSSRRSRRRRRA